MDPSMMEEMVDELCGSPHSNHQEIKQEPNSCLKTAPSSDYSKSEALLSSSSILNLRTTLDNKSHQLSNLWSELYALLGEYKSELFSLDIEHQLKASRGGVNRDSNDTARHRSEIRDLRSQVETLEQHCHGLQGQLEKNQLDMDTKDRLLTQYQTDLIDKDTKITRLEHRLAVFERAGGAASSAVRRVAVRPAPSRWTGVDAGRSVQRRSLHPAAGRVSQARSLLLNRRRQQLQPQQYLRPQSAAILSESSLIREPPATINLDSEPDDDVTVKVEDQSLDLSGQELSLPVVSDPSRGGGYREEYGAGVRGEEEDRYHPSSGGSLEEAGDTMERSTTMTTSQHTDPSTKMILTHVLEASGPVLYTSALANSGSMQLRHKPGQDLRQAFYLLDEAGFGTVYEGTIFVKKHPSLIQWPQFSAFGTTAQNYASAFEKPLNKQTAFRLQLLIERGQYLPDQNIEYQLACHRNAPDK